MARPRGSYFFSAGNNNKPSRELDPIIVGTLFISPDWSMSQGDWVMKAPSTSGSVVGRKANGRRVKSSCK